MAKTSKKNLQESTQAALLEPEPQKLEPESPPEPAMSEPEAEIDNQNDEQPSNIEEGTTVETVETDPGKRVHGPKPNSFGQKDYTILDRLNALETWEGVWAYVYRIQPFSNRLVGGNRKVHVKRYDTAFDVQALMEEAGSGVYQIQATRQNRTTGQRPMFDTGEIRILNMNHPPKIPPGEWVDDPKNKEWLWAKEIIFKKEAPAAAPPTDPIVELLREQNRAQTEAMNRQQDRMDRLQEEMRQSANKKDPSELTFLSILAPLLPAMVAKLTAPPPDPMAGLTAAVTLLQSVTPKVEPVKALDPEEALDRALKLNEKLDALGGGKNSGRSRKTGWQELIADVAPSAAQVLTPIMQMILTGMNRAQQQAGMPPMQMNPNQAQLPQPELTEVQQPHPGPGVGPRPVENRKQPTVEGFADQVLAFLKEGHDGYELGDWYVEQFGIDELNDLREQGKAVILKDLRSCPNPWRFIAVYEESGDLDKFLREFVTWEPGVEDADEEEESPPDEPTAPHQTDMAAGWMPAVEETV